MDEETTEPTPATDPAEGGDNQPAVGSGGGTANQPDAAALEAKYVAAEQARAKAEKERAEMASRLAALEKEANERKAADKAAAEKAKVAGGDLLGLVDEKKAEIAALEAKVATLEAELETLRGRETARTEALKAKNTERLAALPEDLRPPIPEGMDPAAVSLQIDYAEKMADKAQVRPAGGRGGAAPKTPGPEIPPECIAEAKRAGEDPKWYFENVWPRRHRARTSNQQGAAA